MNTPIARLGAASLSLVQRPRRNRHTDWARRLVRETVLTTNDLIWPIFIIDGEKRREPVAAMPGEIGKRRVGKECRL